MKLKEIVETENLRHAVVTLAYRIRYTARIDVLIFSEIVKIMEFVEMEVVENGSR